MSTKKKIMIGGLGALTPIILNLLAVDYKLIFINITLAVFLGYAVKVIILFYLGGLVAYLHKNENSPVKIFELGIVAPALVTTLLNSANIRVNQPVPKEHTRLLQVPPVMAQTNIQKSINTFQKPQESVIQQFWRGLTGIKAEPKYIWHVITEKEKNKNKAVLKAEKITKKDNGFKAVVFQAYDKKNEYLIVIGSYLEFKEAEELKKKAVKTGYRKTYLWKIPEKKK